MFSAGNATLATNVSEFDRRGNLVKSVDLEGFVSTNLFDELDRIKIAAGPATVTVTLNWDLSTYTTNISQQVTTNVYDASGQTLIVFNAVGEKTVTAFDALGRAISSAIYNADGTMVRTNATVYSADQHSSTAIAGSGTNAVVTTTFTDNDGRVVLTQHFPVFGQASPMEFTLQSYDLPGNLAQSKECSSSNGVVTVWATNLWTYDGLNRMATETIKDGATTVFGYNALGSLTNRAMPDGLNWSASYNSAGQILGEQLTGGGLTSRAFTYSYYGTGNAAAGLLQTKTDGRGVAKTTTYDDFLRPSVVTASGTNDEYNLSVTNLYDRRGLLTNTVQAYASTNTGPATGVRRGYDGYGRIVTETAYVGSEAGREIDQVWDAAGRRAAANFPAAEEAPDAYFYQYQADGQMTQIAYGDFEYRFSYTYRDDGLLLARQNGELSVTMDARDGRGRIAHRTSKLGSTPVLTESSSWRSDGRLAGYTAVRGDYTDGRSYSYSAMARRLATETLAVGASQLITNSYATDFGNSGRLGIVTSAAQSGVFASTWSVPSSGGLDGLMRVAQAENTLAERPATGRAIGAAVLSAKLNGRPVPLEYDSGNTNGTWRAQMPLCPGQNTFVVSATHASLRYSAAVTNVYTNLIAAADGISGSFDGNGNFLTRVKRDGSNNVLTTQSLVWDANDRLVKVTERDSQNSGYDWTAVYDPLGRRLRTTYSIVLTNSAQPSPTVLDSWYDPQVEFLEFGVTLNGVDYWKIYGPDLSGRYGGMQGVGGLDAVLHEFPLSFGYSAVVSDNFGNVVGNVEGPLGEPDDQYVTWQATRVGAYGPVAGYPALPLERNQIAGEFLLAPVVTWRGMRIDPTGFYCIGARYYDPEAGRFISADPMGFAGGWDLQGFCQGDPVNFFDPDGRLGVSTLNAYGKLGGFSDRMPFEYRLGLLQSQGGLGGCPGCGPSIEEGWGGAAATWLQGNIGAPLNSVATTSATLNFGSYMAGSFVNGLADMLRLGQGTGNAIYNSDNGWDVAIGITQDVGRAAGIASLVGGSAVGVARAGGTAAAADATATARGMSGVATGGTDLPEITGTWLRGTEGNAGRFPGQIADRLRGAEFPSFDEFRAAFWKEVAADPTLAGQFSTANRALMAQGKAPFVLPSQVTGEGFAQQVYNLHHMTPVEAGGGLYDMGNMLIASPRYHQALHGF